MNKLYSLLFLSVSTLSYTSCDSSLSNQNSHGVKFIFLNATRRTVVKTRFEAYKNGETGSVLNSLNRSNKRVYIVDQLDMYQTGSNQEKSFDACCVIS